MILVNIAPPRLRMADETYGRVLVKQPVKTVESKIIGVVLKMHQDGHLVVTRDIGDQLHRLRIGIDVELLLPDTNRTCLQILLNDAFRLRDIWQFVSEENILLRMRSGKC